MPVSGCDTCAHISLVRTSSRGHTQLQGGLGYVVQTSAAAASVVSDSVRPHRGQPTRLLCPWDSPGKNTGVGCHFLLQCMKVKGKAQKAGILVNCLESALRVKGKECVGLLIYTATLNDSCPTASSREENVGISEKKESVTVSPDQTW